jgi:molybdopterin-guanine dinucleotide biosynthesis protein A
MGQDKGLMVFEKKPLIIYLLETLQDIVDEIIVVFRDNEQLNSYKKPIDTYLSIIKIMPPLCDLQSTFKRIRAHWLV